MARASAIRKRLGGSGSVDEAFPSRPKGMHWRTYQRLEAVDELAQAGWVRATMGWLRI